MHRRTWKRAEQTIARAVDGQRTPTGAAGADVRSDLWCIEIKARRTLPALAVQALEQAERSRNGRQVAAAVLHRLGSRHADDLVVLRWRDFAALLLGDGAADRRVRAAVAMADATDAERAILAPDLGQNETL